MKVKVISIILDLILFLLLWLSIAYLSFKLGFFSMPGADLHSSQSGGGVETFSGEEMFNQLKSWIRGVVYVDGLITGLVYFGLGFVFTKRTVGRKVAGKILQLPE